MEASGEDSAKKGLDSAQHTTKPWNVRFQALFQKDLVDSFYCPMAPRLHELRPESIEPKGLFPLTGAYNRLR